MRALSDLTLDLTLLVSVTILGALVARALLGMRGVWRTVSLAFPIGSGLLTWLVFLASWLGIRIHLGMVWVLLGLGSAACLYAIWRRPRDRAGESEPHHASRLSPPRPSSILVVALAGVGVIWTASNIFVSLGRSYSVWDSAAIWSVKGYGIALEGSVFAGEEWGAHGLSYPLNIPILVGILSLAGGDAGPGSKALFPLYFASLLVGTYEFSRSCGIRREVAAVAALFVGGIPALFMESTTGYANAPMTAYLVLGAMALVRGVLAPSAGEMRTAGVLLGLAGWTRAEGILYSGILLGVGLVTLSVLHRGTRGWLWAAGAAVGILAPWLIFYRLYGAGSSQAAGAISGAIEAFLRGEFRLGSLRIVLENTVRTLMNIRVWGGAWLLPLGLAALGYRRALAAQRAGFLALAAMAAGAAIVTVGLFYVGSFGVGDLRGWLDRSYDRALLPAPVLLTVSGLFLLGQDSHKASAPAPQLPI